MVIEELELYPPQPGEFEVKLAPCAICHSDIHYMEGTWGGALPEVYGHESAGMGDKSAIETVNLADDRQRILGRKMWSTRLRIDVPKLVELYERGRLKLD